MWSISDRAAVRVRNGIAYMGSKSRCNRLLPRRLRNITGKMKTNYIYIAGA